MKQNKSDAKKLASFQKGLVQIKVHVNVCSYAFLVCCFSGKRDVRSQLKLCKTNDISHKVLILVHCIY